MKDNYADLYGPEIMQLMDALREAKCVLYETINKRADKTSLACAWHTVSNALDKAESERGAK
jgi:hypothetical protein